MPRIDELLTSAIVYLYRSRETAMVGEQKGASGFLTSINERMWPYSNVYAVTNRHVIDQGYTTVRLRV